MSEMEKIIDALKKGASIKADMLKYTDENGRNPLMVAIELGYVDVVDKLLDKVNIIKETRRVKDVMYRHTEVGGPGKTTIKKTPYINREIHPYEIDIFAKDNSGMSAFDYAIKKNNMQILLKIYSKRSEVREKEINGENSLKYFLDLLSSDRNNEKDELFAIIELIAKSSYKLDKSSVNTLFSRLFEKDNPSSRIWGIVNMLISGVSIETANLMFNEAYDRLFTLPNEYSASLNSIIQIKLLEKGVSVSKEQMTNMIDFINQKFPALSSAFNELYSINKEDLSTVTNKFTGVIKGYFDKDYLEVIDDYAKEGMIDFNALVNAIVFDSRFKNGKRRLIQLFKLMGPDMNYTNHDGTSVFKYMNGRQLFDVLSYIHVDSLTDIDILEIANIDSIDLSTDQNTFILFKLLNIILDHKIDGNIEEYAKILESPLIVMIGKYQISPSHILLLEQKINSLRLQ